MLASKPLSKPSRKVCPKPSECDIVIVIFWSRMGTPLLTTYVKSNVSPYPSDTEWE